MKKSTFTRLALAGSLLAAASLPNLVQAQGLSFNIGAVSLYKYQGIDQDNRQPGNFIPALQGGVDYVFANGFYIGNWNSTGKFGQANVEIDLYGGFSRELIPGLTADLGLVRYLYPNSGGGWNGTEAYASLAYSAFSVKYQHGLSGWNDQRERLSLSLEHPLGEKISLNAGVGFRNSANFGGARDFHLGLSYALNPGLSASATVSGADTAADKAGAAGKTRLVLGLSHSF
ncbi:TorF family putative porin [Hydrogenophaga sp.]|uniref:TorF family putative porin n=1 Tax=Hydrogenophaga sp. TaxID=1904254 RepID=UPI0019C96C9E|nr:TorF family putative porin [Hydrogenophaga sp.]MBD3893520.1 hypothetical protein [Hydrogenophaga sp.]